MRLIVPLAVLSLILLIGCDAQPPKIEDNLAASDSSSTTKTIEFVKDVHSFARPEECRVTHLDFSVAIDFESRQLKGTSTWTLDKKEDASHVFFDTKELDIEKVWLDDGEETSFSLGDKDETLGQALKIAIKPETKKVHIRYQTDPKAEALMWLDPSQTQGKEHPFFFTQSQAILARTWIPCQDGPGVRFTYTADVQTPDGLMAAMSASNPTDKNADNSYHFEMKQPVPSYLMAMVCGDLEFRAIGDRTGVYAEPSLIDAAHYELGQMQTMLEKAEGLYGKYAWERYDVVFLPPSFPFGGMENPRLTFATPTIIAGDRSLTALIAHELAHSWSGNLVTNATWDDFWLNEGFTVYFEQRIMEEVFGREYSEMLALLSFQGLLDELEEFESENAMEDTHLKLHLKNRNPDDGMSAIAYDKGYLFLRMLEESYGREAFDAFIKNYFSTHAFSVMTTEEFLVYLKANLLETNPELAESCQIDAWVYGPGLPDNCPSITSKKLNDIDQMIDQYFELANLSLDQVDTTGWSAHEYIYFIANCPENMDKNQMAVLDAHFGFTKSNNCEILGKWFIRAAAAKYEEAYPAMEDFLVRVGRRKFLTPIYKELVATADGWEMASDIYKKAEPNYHAVARNTLVELLKKTAPQS